jgi:hypothetical protein
MSASASVSRSGVDPVGPMTGAQIRWIREQVRLTPAQFAELIGASLSSVYRWESAGPSEVAIDPFQHRIFVLLQQQIASRESTRQQELAKRIATGLAIGGGLLGLFHLLNAAFGDEGGGRRRSGGAAARSKGGRAGSSSIKRKKGSSR